MTSPARCTTTVSPTRTSLRSISSSLCRVALETTTPPTVTGLSLAIGVSAPVRPTLIVDRLDDRRRLLGRELVRDRPARRARDEAESLLERKIVDLVDDAVDVVAERRALGLDRAIVLEQLGGRVAKPGQGIGRQAEAAHGLDRAELGRGERLADLAPGVGEEGERPARGDARDRAGAASRRRSCADWRTPACPPPPGGR